MARKVPLTKEERQQWYREMKERRPFYHRYHTVRSISQQKRLPFNLTEEYLQSLWTGYCAISGQPVHLDTTRNNEWHAELDRTVPEIGYVQGNVDWLSRKFNRLKSNATVEDTELVLAYLRRKAYG